eukprot:UN23779
MHFHATVSERALMAKNFLDRKQCGKVSRKDFSRIWNQKFWEVITYEARVDSSDNAMEMWLDIFKDLDVAGFLGDMKYGCFGNVMRLKKLDQWT